MRQNHTLTIGELAIEASVSPDALRHYERRGLIAPTRRTAGGFRVYSPDRRGDDLLLSAVCYGDSRRGRR